MLISSLPPSPPGARATCAWPHGTPRGPTSATTVNELIESLAEEDLQVSMTHDQHCQVGLVIRDPYRDCVRAVAIGARYALAWIDAQPKGLLVGSIHLRVAWSADSEALAAQLSDFDKAYQRTRAAAGDQVEVALGGDWNLHRPTLEARSAPLCWRTARAAEAWRSAPLPEAHGDDLRKREETRSWTIG